MASPEQTDLFDDDATPLPSSGANWPAAVKPAQIIFLAVGTPSGHDGAADLRYLFAATEQLAPHLARGAIVVVKSTVPPGTNRKVAEWVRESDEFEIAAPRTTSLVCFRPRPLPGETADFETLKRWFRQFIEVRDAEGAERCIVSAVRVGADPDELLSLLARMTQATDVRLRALGHDVTVHFLVNDLFMVLFFGTMIGRWDTFGRNLPAKFLIMGTIMYLFGCFQGSTEAKPMN